MDSIEKADIVISTAGRDKGKPFLVCAAEEGFVLLIDGRHRRAENPKRKNVKHVCFVSRPNTEVADKLRTGEPLTNRDVRRILAAYGQTQTAASKV